MQYGTLPKLIGKRDAQCEEMLFYQYLPIKLIGDKKCVFEDRLRCFDLIVYSAVNDFVESFGLERYLKSYVYLTAKKMYQTKGCSFNRPGYHSDGFLTNDINYIWCDKLPTIFNNGVFNLTLDDEKSLLEMEQQAKKENEMIYPKKSLLRLDQYQIHKVSEIQDPTLRTFVKISISEDKYNLKGNSKNHQLNYDWRMYDRKEQRNIPQKL